VLRELVVVLNVSGIFDGLAGHRQRDPQEQPRRPPARALIFTGPDTARMAAGSGGRVK